MESKMTAYLRTKSGIPTIVIVSAFMIVAAGAAHAQDDPFDHPISCETAESDLQVLNAELDHAKKQQALSVTALTPGGAALGILTGKEDEKLEMLSGDYVEKIEKRIADTKAQCNV